METNLLDRMLSTYLAARTPVTITLQNKIRVSGRIRVFDSYVIIIESSKREIIYRHAISSLGIAVHDEPNRILPAAPSLSKNRPRTAKTPLPKPNTTPAQPHTSSSIETNLNNGMKEGLLRWMQEQKAAK